MYGQHVHIKIRCSLGKSLEQSALTDAQPNMKSTVSYIKQLTKIRFCEQCFSLYCFDAVGWAGVSGTA